MQRGKMIYLKKTSLMLIFVASLVILSVSIVSANWVSCCCVGVGWTSAYCTTGDGWADCCAWTSGCSGGWTNVEGTKDSSTCCSDLDCGYGTYCSNHICVSGSHAVDGPVCADKEYRKCDAWCTEPGAWCDAATWTSSCAGSWYDNQGFQNSVDCCSDEDCGVNQICIDNMCETEYTVTISRPDGCYPDYTEECASAKLVIQINPSDKGISIYYWRTKDGSQEQGGGDYGVKTDSSGKIVHTCWFAENPEACPPILQTHGTIVGDIAFGAGLGYDILGVYTNEYVRVGSPTGPKSNVLSFDVRCECSKGEVWNSITGECEESQRCEEDLKGNCCEVGQICQDVGGICSPEFLFSSDCDNRCCRCGACAWPTTQTCEDLDGICCSAGQTCQGGSWYDSSDCGYSCCVSGSCVSVSDDKKITLYKTTTKHNGNFGGRAGVDNFCANNKPSDLTCNNVHAFISVNPADEVRDMPNNYGYSSSKPLYWYHSTEGKFTKFANNWADILDSSIEVNAHMGTGYSGDHWTGSYIDGSSDEVRDPGYGTCGAWTSTSKYGTMGDPLNVNSRWLYNSGKLSCSHNFRLLCMCLAAEEPSVPVAEIYWADMNGNKISEADFGDSVWMIMTGASSVHNFEIFEEDSLLDDEIRTVTGSIIDGNLVGVWKIESEDLDKTSDYDNFKFVVDGETSGELKIEEDSDDDDIEVAIGGDAKCGSYFDKGTKIDIVIDASDADDKIDGKIKIDGNVVANFSNGGTTIEKVLDVPGNLQIVVEAVNDRGKRSRAISNIMILDKDVSGNYVDGEYVAACITKPKDFSNIEGNIVDFDASATRGVRVSGGVPDVLIPSEGDVFSWYWKFMPEEIVREIVDTTSVLAYKFTAEFPVAGDNSAILRVEI